MALSFFNVERGFLHNNAAIIAGAGAPSGTGDTAEVLIGSTYQDTATGDLYVKKVAGAGAENWERLAVTGDITNQLSFREPAHVAGMETSLPTGTAGSTVDIDGVTIEDGHRVLFKMLDSNPNVYTYDLATGTFVEDNNAATAGDMVYIVGGSSGGQTFSYNGTGWVLSNQSNLEEQNFIRTFVGKGSEGSELPGYSSNNYVLDGDNLETAIGKLDAQADQNADDIVSEATIRANTDSALQDEIDDTQTGAGLNADGTYSANSGSNYLTTASSLKSADNLLDAQLKSTTDNLESLETTVNAATAKLDRARTETDESAVTLATTVDSIACDIAAACKWIIHVQGNQAGEQNKKQVVEILATHDGSSSSDATDTDYTVYSKLRMGGNLQGLSFSVDVSGTGAAQVMRLRVSSTASVDVRATREVINF